MIITTKIPSMKKSGIFFLTNYITKYSVKKNYLNHWHQKFLIKSGKNLEKIQKPETFPEINFIISFWKVNKTFCQEIWLKQLKSEEFEEIRTLATFPEMNSIISFLRSKQNILSWNMVKTTEIWRFWGNLETG